MNFLIINKLQINYVVKIKALVGEGASVQTIKLIFQKGTKAFCTYSVLNIIFVIIPLFQINRVPGFFYRLQSYRVRN